MKKIIEQPYLKQLILIIIIMFCWYYEIKSVGTVILILYLLDNFLLIKEYKDKSKDNEEFTDYLDKSLSENFCNLSIPVVLTNEFGDIVWDNLNFKNLNKGVSQVGNNITGIVREINVDKLFKGKVLNNQRLNFNNTLYDISCSNIVKGNEKFKLIYFNDVTDLIEVQSSKEDLREGIVLVEVDNLSEVLDVTDEGDRPLVVAEVERKINSYAQKIGAMIKKYDTNKYVLSVQDKYIEDEVKNKFKILDEISKINKGNKMELTLSVGIGRGGVSPYENNTFATVAKELALGRGGDQVVIKSNEDIKFFGGNTKEIEKRTRVRARVVSHALKELIYDSSNVFIIGHNNPDMDCFGSAVALSSVIRQLGKNCNIVLNDDINPIDYFLERLSKNEKYNNVFISAEEANKNIDNNTLVIIVDVHNRSYVSNLDIIEKVKRKVIIDHHRRSPDIIEGAMLNYIEVYASSTSEMITEIIQYIVDKPQLSKEDAEGLMAGIVMDTKGFSFKTGVRTFEAASFLRNEGADTVEVKKMFTDNLEDYLAIAETIKAAKVDKEKSTAIAVCPKSVDTVIVAKAADELLNISGILACFVLAEIDGNIYISGRSLGDINVQVVLEALGGGGHMNIAGARLDRYTIKEAQEVLEVAISKYLRIGE
ncbi:DHH family phosphoesterase [Clostridium sp. SHJSY1]|uniref:DHH family phosphoesterase n=1 Tax=Clostridium sp. SHJSY1 TaxID=2942483 RepID=UPI002875798C|nr:DHH family phosphoesterase [Clostridium sp. SHJSY1]MDS0527913.1 DHH family phosphoesterase [Clostridium sp. SHJSY1]